MWCEIPRTGATHSSVGNTDEKGGIMEWRDYANCLGADDNIFFDVSRIDEAMEFCQGCVVKAHCRWDATKMRSTGIRGGTTYSHRIHQNGHEPVLILWS
jgi:hypothetical protein